MSTKKECGYYLYDEDIYRSTLSTFEETSFIINKEKELKDLDLYKDMNVIVDLYNKYEKDHCRTGINDKLFITRLHELVDKFKNIVYNIDGNHERMDFIELNRVYQLISDEVHKFNLFIMHYVYRDRPLNYDLFKIINTFSCVNIFTSNYNSNGYIRENKLDIFELRINLGSFYECRVPFGYYDNHDFIPYDIISSFVALERLKESMYGKIIERYLLTMELTSFCTDSDKRNKAKEIMDFIVSVPLPDTLRKENRVHNHYYNVVSYELNHYPYVPDCDIDDHECYSIERSTTLTITVVSKEKISGKHYFRKSIQLELNIDDTVGKYLNSINTITQESKNYKEVRLSRSNIYI